MRHLIFVDYIPLECVVSLPALAAGIGFKEGEYKADIAVLCSLIDVRCILQRS
jgi:hypothetical protein